MMNTPFRSVTAAGNPLTHLVEQARRLQRWTAGFHRIFITGCLYGVSL